MTAQWMIEKARKMTNDELKNWIWMAKNGQPVPGCLDIEALRIVLIERGEDGSGYHNS